MIYPNATVTIIPRSFTTSKIDTVKGNLVCAMAYCAAKRTAGEYYGVCGCEYYLIFKNLYMAWYLLENWEQNTDGSTDGCENAITQEGLTAIIMWADKTCASYI